ncbi:hypothetical protein [Capnocytophaga gingivalis]
MKRILFSFIILSMIGCRLTKTDDINRLSYKNILKDTLIFEKFNFELHKNNYKGYDIDDRISLNGYYKLPEGGSFTAGNGLEEIYYIVIPPSPAFYTIQYDYYKKGNLKSKGKFAGLDSGLAIGSWEYYDESGKLIKEVNEDAKFKFWTFAKILEILHNEKVINLRTGKNRDPEKFRVYFDEAEELLHCEIFKKQLSDKVETYWEYIFDCKTGKYTRCEYERYTKKMNEIPNLPILKKSKEYQEQLKETPYKTFQGKTYKF